MQQLGGQTWNGGTYFKWRAGQHCPPRPWYISLTCMQGRIQPISLGGAISVTFGSQVSLRVHYSKRGEVYFTTLLWQNNGQQNGLIWPMLFSKLCKIMMNKVTFVGFRGDRLNPSPWIRTCLLVQHFFIVNLHWRCAMCHTDAWINLNLNCSSKLPIILLSTDEQQLRGLDIDASAYYENSLMDASTHSIEVHWHITNGNPKTASARLLTSDAQ